MGQDEYIPVKFAEIILDAVLKPQVDNTEAIKELTKSINELIKHVSAPPSNHQLQEYILENREILINKIDHCISNIENELQKEKGENNQEKKELLHEIKALFETNKKVIDDYTREFNEWCKIKESEQEKMKEDIRTSLSMESPINQNIAKLVYWNKMVLTAISIAFSIIMAGITFITIILDR